MPHSPSVPRYAFTNHTKSGAEFSQQTAGWKGSACACQCLGHAGRSFSLACGKNSVNNLHIMGANSRFPSISLNILNIAVIFFLFRRSYTKVNEYAFKFLTDPFDNA